MEQQERKGKNQGEKAYLLRKEIKRRLAEQRVLLPETGGYLIPEDNEQTLKFQQEQLKDLLPYANVHNIFDLELEHGPYYLDYTRNGKYLLLGGRKGHVAILDWKAKNLLSEFTIKDRIRDICWLHNETLMAVAQRKQVYIYDNAGIEIHCLKQHLHPNSLEYLPYHYLLVTLDNLRGILRYHDISLGQIIVEHKTGGNSGVLLRQNPSNGVICLGHNSGQVTMWTPNLSSPAARLQCHPSSITGLAVESQGRYLASASADCRVRVWDLRKYGMLREFFTPNVVPAGSLDISQRGLMALVCGDVVQVWKGWDKEKPKVPYMKHFIKGKGVGCRLRFAPYEDFMGIGHSNGFSSVVVPGSGESNFDSFEANPYESKKQKREAVVRSLLEKLPPDMITIDAEKIGTIDTASKEIKEKEKMEEMKEYEQKAWKKKKKRLREEGEIPEKEDKSYIKVKQKLRAKNMDNARKLFASKLREHEEIEKDLEFLNQIEGKFDPINALLADKTGEK
eukprot:TRINITY_DN3683_c0_g1_i4.p1 TRINITY_DN3683_c0_g1~~TRINITY_DN3683_c0_g1_i4.p1  ORF type:complete len:507 (-),score=145.49 TRINITY_DN3683_c0_g1_i4:148-1668(-)